MTKKIFSILLTITFLSLVSCKKKMLPLANDNETLKLKPEYSEQVKLHKELKK